jgi:phosphohistidine phosphatase
LRHAKSDWNASYDTDRNRPLSKRGIDAARRMGRFLAQIDLVPDVILSSPALRARTTVELASEAGSWSRKIEFVEELYGGGREAALQTIRALGEHAETVLIAGHEPTWSSVVAGLGGGGRVRLPTAALACLMIEAGSWEELGWGRATLEWMVTPKLLKRAGFD